MFPAYIWVWNKTHDTIDLSFYEGIGYILVCSIFKWNWLGLQVYLNIPLSGELYIVYFGTIYSHSQIQCTSIKMDYSTRLMPRVIRPELPSIGLRCILEVLTNGMTATFTQYEIKETFMSRNEERVYLHTTSCACKYQGVPDNYRAGVIQQITLWPCLGSIPSKVAAVCLITESSTLRKTNPWILELQCI